MPRERDELPDPLQDAGRQLAADGAEARRYLLGGGQALGARFQHDLFDQFIAVVSYFMYVMEP